MATSLFHIVFLLLFLCPTNQISFRIPRFDASATNIVYEGDALPLVGVVELINKYKYICRVGRATYFERIPIWNSHTEKATDFTTSFSFIILRESGAIGYGSGLAFFLAPYGYPLPHNSAGGFLGLLNTTTSDYAGTQIIIVEFDPYVNPEWDPKYEHVAINRNSISSVASTPWNASLHDGDTVHVVITYTAATTTLSVNWSYQKTPVSPEETTSLTYQIDLAEVLPEWATIGFSSGTHEGLIRNQILSWDFNSSLERKFSSPGNRKVTKNTIKIILVILVPSAVVAFILGMIAAYFYIKSKQINKTNTGQGLLPNEEEDHPSWSINEYNREMRIPFETVQRAVDNFSTERSLSQGTSGTAFRGKNLETDRDTAVAVRKISNSLGQRRMECIKERSTLVSCKT